MSEVENHYTKPHNITVDINEKSTIIFYHIHKVYWYRVTEEPNAFECNLYIPDQDKNIDFSKKCAEVIIEGGNVQILKNNIIFNRGVRNMKLTYYLFKDTVENFNEIILTKKVNEANNYQELEITNEDLNYEAKVFIQRNKTRAPKWLEFLENDVDIPDKEDMKNTVNSFIILIKINARNSDYFFGITGGMGFTGINKDKLENDFGLKVTLNSINPKELKSLDVRNIDTKAKQKRIHISRGSTISEFGFDFQQDIVNLVSGKSRFEDIGKSMRGNSSLSLNSTTTFETLGDKCRDLLELYFSEDYKEEFDFIDNMRLIKSKELKEKLFQSMWKSMKDKDNSIVLTYPDMIEYEKCNHFKIIYNSKSSEFEDLDIAKLYQFIDSIGISDYNKYSKIKIIGLDEFNHPITTAVSIKEFIVYETKIDNKLYIFTLNNWYYIEDNYYKSVQESVNNIKLIEDGFLFPIKKGESEGEYNERHDNDFFVLMDKRNFNIPNSRSKIEICDLFSKQNHFVCVKKETSSATLSHLFSQGSVSMDLLKNNSDYRKKLIEKSKEKFDDLELDVNNFPYDKSTLVYAISTSKDGDIRNVIPFFSKVNLVQHAKRIKELGVNVMLYKIPVIE